MGGRIKKKNRLLIYLVPAIVIVAITFILLNRNVINKEERTKIEIIENDLDIVYGSDSSEITVFLFSNYSCSYCRKFFKIVYPELKREYIDNGKVKLVVKPVALTNDESVINSLKIAACINKYGNFEKLNELLLAEPKVVYTDEFKSVIDELAEKDLFVAECMYGGESEKYILKNMLDFKRLNCTGTPTFIINNKIYKGNRDYDEFRKVVEKELAYALH